jgi:hypothetical protein
MKMMLGNHKDIPKLGIKVHFVNRALMDYGHSNLRRFKLNPQFPLAKLPIDWTKNNSLSFPIDGNDQYGCCLYAAPCHLDNTWTGNVGTESVFNEKTIIADYLKLSGGDNGLNEEVIVPAWKKGLVSNPEVNILDAMDIDPTNTTMAQSAIYLFGGIIFMLSVPDNWINDFNTGYVWDVPATADPNNGHAVLWNAADSDGNFKVQTWGTYGYITPAAVKVCDPTAFTVFSMRWFNSQGFAPNGLHYTELSQIWTAAGGIKLPDSPFPAPVGPTPTPITPVADISIYIPSKTIVAPGYTLSVEKNDKVIVNLYDQTISTPEGWLPI